MTRELTLLAALAALGLVGCSESPEGKPVTRTVLDGKGDKAAPAPTPTATPTQAPGPSACENTTFEGVPITHCIADPAQHRIRMANLGPDKQPFGSLAALADPLRARLLLALERHELGVGELCRVVQLPVPRPQARA